MNVQRILEEAIACQRAGDVARAEALCRQVLTQHPQNTDAHNLLALVTFRSGRGDEAIVLVHEAIRLDPRNAAYHANLGTMLLSQDRVEEAVAAYRQAVDLVPQNPELLKELANALIRAGHVQEAIAAFRQAITQRPDFLEALNSLGAALGDLGEFDEAIGVLRRAVGLWPDYRDAWNNLGNVLCKAGRAHEAKEAFAHILSRNPDDAIVLNNLGALYDGLSQHDQAVQMYRRAIAANPKFSEACHNLGVALQKQGKLEDGIDAFRSAISLKSDLAVSWINLGNSLRETGQLEEAFASLRRGLAIKDDASLSSTMLYLLHFDPTISRRQLFDEHRRWNEKYARPLQSLIRPHGNDPDPNRRLRIGYVSPDLGNHSVGRFMVTLLGNHDHSNVQVFCYSDAPKPDPVLKCNRAQADVWRETQGLDDQHLADLIREDRIDVLVDLTMHMVSDRMLMFARKPAPVQVTYLAYLGTTGLETMDYRLTDPHLDPPGSSDEYYSEESFRLPRTYWCYNAPSEAPAAVAPPSASSGQITFGSMNNFGKVSAVILPAWIRILKEVPNSRLLLHSREGSHRRRFCDLLESQGIDRRRIDFIGFVGITAYFEACNRIDIALDTFPYPGGTTSCDTLWMGVPVVTLAGEAALSRAGVSILSNIGLPELIASDPDQYVRIARELASDLPRLSQLRSGMRQRMLSSPLMNGPQFARDVEAAYRQMWRRWCESKKAVKS